jgi:hypothetical protein
MVLRSIRSPRDWVLEPSIGGGTPKVEPLPPDDGSNPGFVPSAVSRVGRDELFESFGWSLPCEGFAWSPVEFEGDRVEFVLGVDREVGAFGEELAGEPVPV